jgi:hypothetical protein
VFEVAKWDSDDSVSNSAVDIRAVRDVSCKGKGKGKSIPLQAWTGPEGSRRLRLTDFKTIGT